jgi:hypothetical protein
MEDLDHSEVDELIEDAGRQAKRLDVANFVYELPGNLWNLPDSEFGWKRCAQEWGLKKGLVEQKIQEGTGHIFIVLTERGDAFKARLKERGITIFSEPKNRL